MKVIYLRYLECCLRFFLRFRLGCPREKNWKSSSLPLGFKYITIIALFSKWSRYLDRKVMWSGWGGRLGYWLTIIKSKYRRDTIFRLQRKWKAVNNRMLVTYASDAAECSISFEWDTAKGRRGVQDWLPRKNVEGQSVCVCVCVCGGGLSGVKVQGTYRA